MLQFCFTCFSFGEAFPATMDFVGDSCAVTGPPSPDKAISAIVSQFSPLQHSSLSESRPLTDFPNFRTAQIHFPSSSSFPFPLRCCSSISPNVLSQGGKGRVGWAPSFLFLLFHLPSLLLLHTHYCTTVRKSIDPKAAAICWVGKRGRGIGSGGK